MDPVSGRRYYLLKLTFYTLAIILLGALVGGFGLFILLPSNLGNDYRSVITAVAGMQKTIVANVVEVYAVVSMFTILAVMVLNLFYSHRIAGPAYRIGRESAVIGKGNLKGGVQLRRKDNLKDLAHGLNDVARMYRDRILAVRGHLSLIEALSQDISGLLEREESGALLERNIIEMEDALKRMDAVLSEIRP